MGFAQRFVHPNGTRSRPFIAPLSKRVMVDFAIKIMDGYWPKPAAEFPAEERDDLGSARIEIAYDGKFRRTLEMWGMHGDYAALKATNALPRTSPAPLSYGDILIAFLELGEGGAPNTYIHLGGQDLHGDIAKTTIAWARCVEEWEGPLYICEDALEGV